MYLVLFSKRELENRNLYSGHIILENYEQNSHLFYIPKDVCKDHN